MKGINVQVVKSGNEMKNLFTIETKLGLESPNLTLKPLNGGTILLRNRNTPTHCVEAASAGESQGGGVALELGHDGVCAVDGHVDVFRHQTICL